MKTMKLFLSVFLGTVLLIAIGFAFLYRINKPEDLPDNMHTRAGTFDISYGNTLKIDNTNGKIDYSASDSKGNMLFSDQYHFSDYQRWYIVSDAEGSVWVYSSDIGDVLYKRSADNEFKQMDITSELCKKSPDSFRDNLPNTLKALWKCGVVEK